MLNFFPSNFRDDIHFSSRWISAKQLPNRGRCENFGAKLTHPCEFLRLLIGRIIFIITRAITSFAILIGRIIFLKCELQLFACENLWHSFPERVYQYVVKWIFLTRLLNSTEHITFQSPSKNVVQANFQEQVKWKKNLSLYISLTVLLNPVLKNSKNGAPWFLYLSST